MPAKYCWFDVTIGGRPLKERIVMEMFDEVTPKTCENFRQLCLGNGGATVEGSGVSMTYKGCSFHRVIAGFMVQGGDFTNHNGTGGCSIYGEKFEDENFEVACERAGLLAMANAGPNTNGSQFFITAAPTPHLTGRHVVFGKVVRGMNAVRAVEHTETGSDDKPVEGCLIAECGVMDALPEELPLGDGDTFSDYPEDAEPALSEAAAMEAGEAIRTIGNNLFKRGEFESAMGKYAKAIRYLDKADHTSSAADAVQEKRIACHNNTAMCAIKLGQWRSAATAASAVLQMDPQNSKALFRRGTAALSSGDVEGAIADLSAAHKADAANAEIAEKLQQAKDVEKARKAKLAANLKKMFA